ncbi:hypothetical protein E3N88_00916 [Mikania micrantha]|uniref:Uncharacterized protein n=1 Tax=Mikania micrantha TaxID=192012 RepID=A0A5N6Q262_9ASTR|nr:hypothetical protein E3N88_00916 [Mikania micrantha]
MKSNNFVNSLACALRVRREGKSVVARAPSAAPHRYSPYCRTTPVTIFPMPTALVAIFPIGATKHARKRGQPKEARSTAPPPPRNHRRWLWFI